MFTNPIFQKQKALLLFIGAILLFCIALLSLLITSFVSQPETQTTLPTPTPLQSEVFQSGNVSPLQRVSTGDTVEKVEDIPSIEDVEELPDGTTRYSLTSPLISRKNEIRVRNGSVIFERILVPENPNATGYARVSDYIKFFGEPEASIRGSRFYGHLIHTLIYAEKGFTLIANTRTDEVYEIQVFQPTSVAEYKERFGEDIDEDAYSL